MLIPLLVSAAPRGLGCTFWPYPCFDFEMSSQFTPSEEGNGFTYEYLFYRSDNEETKYCGLSYVFLRGLPETELSEIIKDSLRYSSNESWGVEIGNLFDPVSGEKHFGIKFENESSDGMLSEESFLAFAFDSTYAPVEGSWVAKGGICGGETREFKFDHGPAVVPGFIISEPLSIILLGGGLAGAISALRQKKCELS